MNKIKYIIITISIFMFGITNVSAASASLSVSSSTIENGKSVTATVYLSSTAAWNVTISSSGATSGCTEKFVGDSGTGTNTNKSFSVTCKATSQGAINFSISGDITDQSGSNSGVSGSRSVTVTAPRPKSADNNLKSLSVDDYELIPAFDKNTKEYVVNVPSTTETINIKAEKSSTYASIDGIGEKPVEMGTNIFEIKVTSETGSANIYKITVNVEDLNPIEVTVDKIQYTIVKELKNLTKPELFEESNITINDIEIPAFKNDKLKYTLVGLKDPNGKIDLFIYKDNKYTKYNEFVNNKTSIVYLEAKEIPKGFKKNQIKINDELTTVYEKEDITLIYGINITSGKENFYKYDKEENTIQLYKIDNKVDTNFIYITYALAGISIILFLINILQAVNKKKYKKIIEKINKKSNE